METRTIFDNVFFRVDIRTLLNNGKKVYQYEVFSKFTREVSVSKCLYGHKLTATNSAFKEMGQIAASRYQAICKVFNPTFYVPTLRELVTE